MAKVIKVNYNSRIVSYMHRPITNGPEKYILYPKNREYTGAIEGNTKAEQDPEYIKLSSVFANSPTNIRQVFITGNRVYTYLYAGIQEPKADSSTSFMKAYDKNDESMFDIARKYIDYEIYKANRSIDEPDRYIVEGNILGAVAHPYTCNNIEEIYLDWTVFLSNDPVITKHFGQYTTPQAINNWLNNNYGYNEVNASNQIQEWFMQNCMDTTKDLRKRFPRLKMIAIVSKLDELITRGSQVMLHTLDSELVENNKAKVGKTWYDLNKERIQASGSQCFVCRIPGADRETLKIKDQQYRFDKEYLKPKLNTFLTKLKAAERKARYGDTEDSPEELAREASIVAGDAENYLVELEKKYGIDFVKNVLGIIVYDGATKTELTKFFSEFTKPNRQKYAPLAGLKL